MPLARLPNRGSSVFVPFMAETAGIIPSWVKTLDAMIAAETVIKVQCDA